MRKSRYMLMLLPFLWLYLLSAVPAYACVCSEFYTPSCASYSRAATVFAGTLTRIERGSRQGLAHFRVEKTYKGASFEERDIAFIMGSCAEAFDFLKTGEKYLIYADTRGWTTSGHLEMSPCGRSRPLSDAVDDLEYIEKVLQKKALPSVAGMLNGLTEKDLKSMKVSVTGEQVNIISSIDTKKGFYPGYYSIDVPKAGTYRIKVLILFEGASPREVFEYTASLVENQCDYREIPLAGVTKADK